MLKSLFLIIVSFFFFVSCGDDNPVQTVEEDKIYIEVYKREHLYNGKFIFEYRTPKLLDKNYIKFYELLSDTSKCEISLKDSNIDKFIIQSKNDTIQYIIQIKDKNETDTYYRHYFAFTNLVGTPIDLYGGFASYIISGKETLIKDYVDNSTYVENISKVKEIIIKKKYE